MLHAKLIAIAAAALFFAQIQCVTACAAQVGTPPPCYQHHNQTSTTCPHQILAANTPTAPTTPILAIAALIPLSAMEAPAGSPDSTAENRLTPSPPGPKSLSLVLRI